MPSFTRESGGTLHVAVMGVNRIGKDCSLDFVIIPSQCCIEYSIKNGGKWGKMGSRRGETHRNVTNTRVMDLILDMSSRTAGMTTSEITQKYAIDRATAGRWLTSIETDYGYEIYEIDRLYDDHHRTKRWKIRRYSDPELVDLPEMDQARARGLKFHKKLDTVERRQLERLRDRLEGDEKTGLTKLLADAVGLDGLALETERLIAQTAYTVAHPVPWTQVCLTRRA